jgi:hypothetical protein
MEILLSNYPLDYLKHLAELHKLAKQKSSLEEFKINGINVYEDDITELYSGEEFKTHSGINIEVSNYGRLRCKGGIVKQEDKKEGYPYTYRLVAETWLSKEGYNEVHHIINNGYNNSIFNLMWVTNKQHSVIENRTPNFA